MTIVKIVSCCFDSFDEIVEFSELNPVIGRQSSNVLSQEQFDREARIKINFTKLEDNLKEVC